MNKNKKEENGSEIRKKKMAVWKNLNFNRGNIEQNLGWAVRSLVQQFQPLSMLPIYCVILDMQNNLYISLTVKVG